MSEPSAFIDLREIARVECFWFVGDGTGVVKGDWMGIIYRPMGTGSDLLIKYRFRYYEDDQAFHSSDRKSSYVAHAPKEKLADAIAAMDETATMMRSRFGGEICRKRFVEGTPRKFRRWLLAQPFSHTRTQSQFDRTRPQ